MPNYQEYLQYAKTKGFQPLSEQSFKLLVIANFNPISGEYLRGQK
tara:strand:+ start:887 stop:1021 length:135 start_codon:yes stop_codon:yes gene_type:complete